ncbi:TIGR02450 family Trp-rich protein [Pseudomonas sp.]|uniref:TIGR02450 family Trp-rich protein n=1 Tax=Pseudomonas sp. TaxID=306 RepID=UPI002736311A|nr:TIGR02450 family Trp-rich protein [Pseudomonas sp.]MDP2748443.1 TIGR02450 family Trp-rich protein [Pseudomonas sp.]MDZ4334011.1 TIGR02450 family Trp-rich protein [Pseudomonas sp.]
MNTPAHTAPAKHRLNPRKLLLSKWTAAQPQNREKHFLVTELFCDEDGTVLQIELQAVLNQRCQRLDWRVLENPEHWRMGWK